ncbi:hypothetical protein CICLE_v10033206mg [Citrus x clementina]|uniref:Uncharacterized protein n=1 Tax=Citrus clementina TaxID=85681 RepID=V4T987_CITCL|nr:hypothetical protein CICLE_v10033206mg [Citrus x clementina]
MSRAVEVYFALGSFVLRRIMECVSYVKEAAVGSAFLRSTFYGFKKKIIKKYIHTKIQHCFEYILNNLKFKYQCSFKKLYKYFKKI